MANSPGQERPFGGRGRLFTIPAHRPFADDLAAGLLAAYPRPEDLARLTVLSPNRRGAAALEAAFARLSKGRALLLPRLAAIADAASPEESEDLILAEAEAAINLPPAMDPLRRRVLLAREIRVWHENRGDQAPPPDLALGLAGGLTRLLDEMQIEGCRFEKLEALAAADYPEHWGLILDFLGVLRRRWPEILAAENVLDPMDRRDRAIRALAESWRADPPKRPVVVAGSTGSMPATARLIAAVAAGPNGMVVLPGLDRDLDEESWAALGPAHPQYGLKRLLRSMDAERSGVADWPGSRDVDKNGGGDGKAVAAKRRLELLRMALLPVETTPVWAEAPPLPRRAWDGLRMIECRGPREEAATVAAALREALETPQRRAALVTADRGLARRVVAELRRWNIEIDDSAGRPLAVTRAGAFLRLVAEAAADGLAPVSFVALCRHPLAAAGLRPAAFRDLARGFEQAALRGPRPAPGPDGLRRALERALDRARNGDRRTAARLGDGKAVADWLEDVLARLTPLTAWSGRDGGEGAEREHPAAAVIAAHLTAALSLAASDGEDGAERLWRGEDGAAAADLMARLTAAADDLPGLGLQSYAAVLRDVMADAAVRPAYGGHPRLFVWGPLEARLQHCDRMIIGGLNEGSWPRAVEADPWLGRQMREEAGLPPPERRIGLAAHDFAQLAAGPEVLMTRSVRAGGAPTEASRWWRRLALFAPPEAKAFLDGGEAQNGGPARYRDWARALDRPLDRPQEPKPCGPPAPKPPLDRRPRRISATQVEGLIRDPYAFYARRILGLEALEPLDADPGAAERGQGIHTALEEFSRRSGDTMPADAAERLIEIGERVLEPLLALPGWRALWWPRFRAIADWFTAWDKERRGKGVCLLAVEAEGEITVGETNVILTARADRIDRLAEGGLAIIDYKTGTIPRWNQVERGEKPQLPLEALIALRGGFKGVGGETAVATLTYLHLSGRTAAGKESTRGKGDPARWADEAEAGLGELLRRYADPAQGYPARSRPERARGGDYDHLARRGEWS